jgi:hypothetical protein
VPGKLSWRSAANGPSLVAPASCSNFEGIVAAGIQSAMCPLGKREHRFGPISSRAAACFTVDDLNVFTVIAAQASLTLDTQLALNVVDGSSSIYTPQPL